MVQGSPNIATHLLEKPENYLTTVGSFLRKTSLDELPQLGSVLLGHMSIVGPRPALFNQYELIELRSKFGVSELKPGITGLAQINGRDEISIPKKVQLDYEYKLNQSFILDLKIIYITIIKVFLRKNINH